MFLQNETIYLRALEPEDLDILLKWENNTDYWEYGSTNTPFSRLMLRQYLIDSQNNDIYQSRQLRLMIQTQEEISQIVGAVDLYEYDPHNNRAGLGIIVEDRHQGKHYAMNALQLMIDYAFGCLHIHQLYVHVALDNEKSVNLFGKLNFEVSGTLKQWKRCKDGYKDVYIMQLMNNGKL